MLFILFFIFSSTYYVDFNNASGILKGMPVYYKGIEIGSVDEVSIGDNLKPRVKINIKKKYKNLMREGCGIKISKDGLELFSVDEKKPRLPSNSLIKGVKNPIDEIIFGLKKLKENFKKSKFKDEMEDIIEEMDSAYKKGKEEFKEKWPLFKEKLRKLKEKIKGDKNLEEELDKTIDEGDQKNSNG